MVVTAGHLGAEGVVDDGGAHALDLIRRHGDADAGAAAEDAEGAFAARDRLCDPIGVDGIVDAFGAVGAEVFVGDAVFVLILFDGDHQVISAVVAAECYHVGTPNRLLSSRCACGSRR